MEIITPFTDLENKTGKHKDWYSVDFVNIFCKELNPENEYFNNKKFVIEYKNQFKNLELKERLNLIASLLEKYLDINYKKKLKVFRRLLGNKLELETGMFTYGFHLYPISQFIEKFGTTNVQASLIFIEDLTMRFTGEWAIRPLANESPKEVLKKMKEWSRHENFHVRRLASEGLRARLPWGMKISWIESNPEKNLPIYNKLRNDKVLYVRRSVANSMGDLIKINEKLAFKTFEKWLSKKKTKENLWVIKHAIRTPVKKKNSKYLRLHKEIKELMLELA